MNKLIATSLVAAMGVVDMNSALHAQATFVETPRLHISEDGDMLARRVLQMMATKGPVRMAAICHDNGDIRIGFVVDASSELGRPLPVIGIKSENGTERVFDAHLLKPDNATVIFFAAPANMRMNEKRPTKLIERIAQSRDFSVALSFSEQIVEASFDGHMAALATLYISALCGLDPLS